MDVSQSNGIPCRIEQLLCQTREIVLIFHRTPEESPDGIYTFFSLYDKNRKRAYSPLYNFGRLRRLVELLNISSGVLMSSPDEVYKVPLQRYF
jgi:hypothetical protein